MEKTINEKILDLLHDAVVSEGGDGSALWLSKYGDLQELLQAVIKYNSENNIGWRVVLGDLYILWYDEQESFTDEQESITITNNGEYFMGQDPSFYDLILEY